MKYTKEHEWVELKDNIATVGLTKLALDQLEDIVNVQWPANGQRLTKGELVCVLESNKSAIELYTPLSGKIVAVNEQKFLTKWLYKIELFAIEEYEDLLDWAEYKRANALKD